MKWFLRFADEDDTDAALELLRNAAEGELRLWQPPHFVAEVASVLARVKPEEAMLDVRDLLELDFEQIDDNEIYARGTDLATTLNHHLFDTLYHALALSTPGATLITADRRYFRKANSLGRISMLEDWGAP